MMIELNFFDWSMIIGYILFSVLIGILLTRRSGKNTDEFFLSGRCLPWWIAGTSMVATTFAVDTPLVVSSYVWRGGLWLNWYWWAFLLSGLLGVFLFSKLWRRANVTTDIELIELRYTGKPAAVLRGFKAGYFAIFYNLLVMGWVFKAMSKVIEVMVGSPKIPLLGMYVSTMTFALISCATIAVIYTLMSGYWGVVVTDFFQFILAMAGAILLAYFCVNQAGGLGKIREKIQEKLGKGGIVGSYTLKGKAVQKPHLFILKLKQAKDPVSKYFHSHFPQKIQKRLSLYQTPKSDPELFTRIIFYINQIKKGYIYDETRFKKVHLSQDSMDMLKKKEKNLELLNLYLIEDAYPKLLSKSRILSAKTLDTMPEVHQKKSGNFWENFLKSPFFKFLVFILVLWWCKDNADGGGYIIQRMMSCKNEAHAVGATLWYNFAHYVLRPWPWILVGVSALLLIDPFDPNLMVEINGKIQADYERVYPLMIGRFVPIGLRGVLIASFVAAFMSTIDTHLTWGSSYLVNDIYKRFCKKEASEKHYVWIARLCIFLLAVFAGVVAFFTGSIDAAWKFVATMGSGIGLVLILRWYWWRINAWSEISALATSIVMRVLFEIIAFFQCSEGTYKLFAKGPVFWGFELQFHHMLLIIVPTSILVWVTVTLLTKPEPQEILEKFCRRVRPGGFWGPIRDKIGNIMPKKIALGFFISWVCGIGMIYGAMLSIGQFILGRPGLASILLCISIISAVGVYKMQKTIFSAKEENATS